MDDLLDGAFIICSGALALLIITVVGNYLAWNNWDWGYAAIVSALSLLIWAIVIKIWASS